MSFLQTGEEEEGEGQEGARARRARLGKLRTFDLILEAEGDGVRLTFRRNLSWRGPACSWGAGDGSRCQASTVPQIPATPAIWPRPPGSAPSCYHKRQHLAACLRSSRAF